MALRAGYYGLKRSLFDKVKALPGIKSIGTGLSLDATTGELETTGTTISVEANPEGAATDNLIKLGLGDEVYAVPDASKTYQTDDATESAIVDADYIPFFDSSAASGAGAPKKSTWTNFISKIKAKITEFVTWEANGVLGAKNLLINKAQTITVSDITFTVNADGSVIANGTASALAQLVISSRFNYDLQLPKGKYKLTGSASDGGDSKWYMVVAKNKVTGDASQGYDDLGRDTGNGFVFELSELSDIQVLINIVSGQAVNNIVFKPMITLASDTDDTYVPYAMTNKDLTDNVFTKRLLTSADDFDDIEESGIYNFSTSPAHAPEGLQNGALLVINVGGNIQQIVFWASASSGGFIYNRAKSGSPAEWRAWYKHTGTIVS